MEYTLKRENAHLIADVTFGKEEIDTAREKSLNKLAKEVTVPGFRKGKAPLQTAIKYVKNDRLFDAMVNSLLRVLDKNFNSAEDFQAYVTSRQFLSYSEPKVELLSFKEDLAQFKVTYCLRSRVVKLGDYNGLTSNVTQKEVTDEDVQHQLVHLAQDNAELVPSENPAEIGDTVNIDFVGLMNGQAFEGGSAKSFDLELGSKRFVPGFEEQCVSHRVGDKFDIPLTLPDNYPEPLNGKAVVFKVTINAVKTKEIPAIDDEFATTLSGKFVSDNLEDLKNKVRNSLIEDARNSYKRDLLNDLLLQVRNASEFELSSEEVAHFADIEIKQNEERINRQGLTLDEYLKLISVTKDNFEASIRDGISGQIKNELVYNEIAIAEKIPGATKEELTERIGNPIDEFVKNYTDYLKSIKLSDEAIRNQINDYLNQLSISIFQNKVQLKLLEINGYSLEEKKEESVEQPQEEKKEEPAEVEETKAE